jgi:hypothetical protein
MIRIFLFSIFLAALAACSSPFASKPADAPAQAQPASAPPVPTATPAVAPTPVAQTAAPPAAPAGSLATQDTNEIGIAADFTECKRKDGVLSVMVRFRNVSSAPAKLVVFQGGNYPAFYVTAANKKYFLLQDSEGTYLTSAAGYGGFLTVPLAKDQQFTWWAKFPAPPADVKKISLMTPLAAPFEDIPIADQ